MRRRDCLLVAHTSRPFKLSCVLLAMLMGSDVDSITLTLLVSGVYTMTTWVGEAGSGFRHPIGSVENNL